MTNIYSLFTNEKYSFNEIMANKMEYLTENYERVFCKDYAKYFINNDRWMLLDEFDKIIDRYQNPIDKKYKPF